MDWSWESEYISHEYPGFSYEVSGDGNEYRIVLTPEAP